jgi:hypothetical protein
MHVDRQCQVGEVLTRGGGRADFVHEVTNKMRVRDSVTQSDVRPRDIIMDVRGVAFRDTSHAPAQWAVLCRASISVSPKF